MLTQKRTTCAEKKKASMKGKTETFPFLCLENIHQEA